MSKKLTLFALVAVLVMAFAGSAFAEDRTWVAVGGTGDWGTAQNWNDGAVKGIPTSVDRAVFPNSAVKVNVTGSHDVGAILIDSGANNVEFNFTKMDAWLHVDQTQIGHDDGKAIPGIQAKGNATFGGEGKLVLRTGAVAGATLDTDDIAAHFLFDVVEGATLDIGVVTSADAAVTGVIKANKGTLEFSANQDNTLGTTVRWIDVRDGVLAIGRSGHVDSTVRVFLDNKGIQGRTSTLRTTWSGADTFRLNKVMAVTNGIIDVSGEGSTLNLTTATPVVSVNGGRTVTKAGPGTISMGSRSVWATVPTATSTNSTIDIVEGNVNLASSYATSGDNHVNIKVGTDTNLVVEKVVSDDIRNLTGSGTLTLNERGVLIANGPSTSFSGKITGAGSIRFGTTGVRTANAVITGTENDYTGDTFVGSLAPEGGSRLTIEDAANLGGANKWSTGKVYLDAAIGGVNAAGDPVGQEQVTPANIENYARLVIADGKNFTLPNEIFIGDSLVEVHANANRGPAIIFVPVNTQLTLSKNVTYNRNTLAKAGEGDIIMENIGYDSIGGANFIAAQGGGVRGGNPIAPYISAAIHIVNGRVRLENDMAASAGDIVADSGTSTANRAILSVRNGIKMNNHIMFTAQSTFQTELKTANLSSGTDVQSAVETGMVFYNRHFTSGIRETQSYTGLVYNRVNFDELDGKTISKGDRFQLMKSNGFYNYGSNQVYPTDYDGLDKAPFDPYFSTVYLYFDALKTIDVPVIGQPSVTSIKKSSEFNFTVPVTSVSGLKADSQSVFTTPAIADVRATIEGTNLRIRGTAPESGQVTFLVRVSSMGDAQDTLEYMGERTFTLAVTDDGGSTPEKPSSNVPAPTVDKTAGTIVASAFKYDADGNAVINETLKFVLTDVNYVEAARGSFVDGVYELTDITGTDGKASVTFTEIGEGEYTLAVFDASGAQIGTTRAINDFKPTDPEQPSGSSGSSGCDAGFGAFALLALGAAVVLRKKD